MFGISFFFQLNRNVEWYWKQKANEKKKVDRYFNMMWIAKQTNYRREEELLPGCNCDSCLSVIANPFCSTHWLTHSTVSEGAKQFSIHRCLRNGNASSFPCRTIGQPTPLYHFHRVTGRFSPPLFRTSCKALSVWDPPQVRMIILHSGQQTLANVPENSDGVTEVERERAR